MSRNHAALILGALLSTAAGPALAQPPQEADLAARANPEYRFDFSVFGGGHFFASEHALGRTPDSPPEISPRHSGLFGATLGMHLNRWIGIEAELVGIPTKTRGVNPDNGLDAGLFILGYRGSFVLNLSDAYRFKPYLLAGYGGLSSFSSDQSVVVSENWSFVHAGAGFKVGFVPRFGLRFDGRIMVPWTAIPGIPHGDRVGYTSPDFEVFAGLYVNFGEVERIHIYQKEKVVPTRGDKDGDGIPDDVDKCPAETEDKDGFEDTDGCPDTDNDKDGVADAVDKCPTQPETVNHYKDEDGCPDEIPAEVKKFTGVIEGINFKTNSSDILPGSYAVLDRALKVLQDFPDVNLEISGHTDSKGRDSYNLSLSQRRADSVKLYFVSRGISSARLVSIGYGESRPIGDNASSSGRAMNRRTEFKLIDSGKK